MHKKPNYAIFSAMLALTLAALACNGGAAPTKAPTQAPAATQAVAAPSDTPQSSAPTATEKAAPTTEATVESTTAPTEGATTAAATEAATSAPTAAALSGSLDVHGVSGYVDSLKYYRVDGLLTNGTDKPVSSIELSLQLSDSGGKTVLKDDSGNPTSTVTFQPILSEIGSGETTPFEYYFDAGDADTTGWKAEVKLDSSEPFSDFARAPVTVANNLLTVGSDGDIYLTGELVNGGNSPTQINNFAAALLDGSGNVAATSSFQDVARLLAPAGDASGSDRTPFVVRISGPIKGNYTPSFYIDGVPGKQSDVDGAAPVHLKLETTYVDSFNNVHMVATVSNSGTETMTARVMAGLYAQDGSVLDGSSTNAPINLAPGVSVPVHLYYFSNLNGNADLVGKVISSSAQIDPYWTFPVTNDLVTLEAGKVTTQVDGSSITIKGDVVNNSGQTLIDATVVVILRDADGKLVAADRAYTDNSGDIAPKATETWSVTVDLPTDVDATKLKIETIVQGDVKS